MIIAVAANYRNVFISRPAYVAVCMVFYERRSFHELGRSSTPKYLLGLAADTEIANYSIGL